MNTFIGYQAGVNNGNGHQNIGIGASALAQNAAWSNVVVGNSAGEDNTTGTKGVFLGRSAAMNNTTGANNIAIGFESLKGNTTGSDNIAIGDEALKSGAAHTQTIAIGTQVHAQGADSYNVAIGYYACRWQTGDSNVAIGHSALHLSLIHISEPTRPY